MKIDKKLKRELPPKRGERLITRAEALDACAYDEQALRIIENSSFTTHNRVGLHRHLRAANILNDFFEVEHLRDKTILELGPGHYSFAMLARHFGAKVICVERYEPHVALGRHLGFKVLDCDFRKLTPQQIDGPLDGLWMKGAFNACGFPSDEAVGAFARQITALLKPDAWGWCVTVNMYAKDGDPTDPQLNHRIEVQRDAFAECGWEYILIDEADRKRYAISYAGSRYYFTRNLLPAPSQDDRRPASDDQGSTP